MALHELHRLMGDDYQHKLCEVDLVQEPETVWEAGLVHVLVVMELHLVRRLALQREPCKGTYYHWQNDRLEVLLLYSFLVLVLVLAQV